MKIRNLLMSMFAIAALASCSNENEIDNLVPNPETDGLNAYISVSIQMPQGAATRADGDPGTDHGTTDEQAIKTVYLVGLNGEQIRGVYQLTVEQQGTIGIGGKPAVKGTAIKVAGDINNLFAIINPSTTFLARAKAASTYAAMNRVIEEEVGTLMESANGFMMTSAGAAAADKGLVVVEPSKAASESTTAINAAKDAAVANPALIFVDRAMVKVGLSSNAPTVENGTASITGWLMNTTNKSYLPYAELVSYTLGGTPAQAKYRQDNNWSALGMNADGTGAAIDAFNWLHNKDTYTWNSAGTTTYCHENTMEAAAQDYNNTTKMTVKAEFAPAGITKGQSWFRMGGIVYTLAELQAIYNNETEGSETRNAMDAFYTKFFGITPSRALGSFSTITIEELDAVANGGYVAATVNPYVIEYFQKSICYYDVLINHDSRVEAKLLGRWGVVRNNSYTVNITKISKPGKPYIPDPTDPAITDPANPDPINPTPDDEASAFIAVSITVNPWTTWSQDNEL